MSAKGVGVQMCVRPKEKSSLFLLRKLRGGGTCVRTGRAVAGEAAQTGGGGKLPGLACMRKSHGTETVSEKKHLVWENPWPSSRVRLPWSSELEREQVGTGVTALLEQWRSLT